MDKEDSAEDRLDGLQKQTVSPAYCIGNPHGISYRERNPHLACGETGELDCIAEAALYYPQDLIMKISNRLYYIFILMKLFCFQIAADFRCSYKI
jgi:hypothetical protein